MQVSGGAEVCKVDRDPDLFGYVFRYLQGDCGEGFFDQLTLAGLRKLRSESSFF